MAQTFYPITPVEVTPGTVSAWTDVDVSAYVPAGATGVILHCVNTSASNLAIGVRKNGSTDNRTQVIGLSSHNWAAMGVDASRIFEAYVGSTTSIDIYLVGYTMSGVTFFTNAYNKSLTALTTWTDINCATEAPSAIGLIWEVITTNFIAMGMRMNGSADARIASTSLHRTFGIIIGCDTSQIVEGYIGDTTVDFFLVGYITDGATFNLNATDVSLTTINTWLDLTVLPATANMGFIEVNCNAVYNYGLRKNGSAEDIYSKASWHPWAFVECDASYIIEGKISNVAVDFFVVGYATAGAGPIIIERTSSEALGTISDATARAITRAVPISEAAISVADSLAYNLQRAIAINEAGISVADSPAYNLLRAIGITEPSISVADALSYILRRVIDITETAISASDIVATEKITPFTPRDVNEPAISVADVLSYLLIRAISISEASISVADAPIAAFFKQVSISEPSIGITDSLSLLFLRGRVITEPAITIADAVSYLLQRAVVVNEPAISVADSPLAALIRALSLSEPAISIGDVVAYILQRTIIINEPAITISDTVIPASIMGVSLSEPAITVADSSSYLLERTIAISEPGITVSDLVEAGHLFSRGIAESIGAAAGVFPIIGGSHIIEIIGED